MKIGIFTNLYPPFARGGAEIVMAEIAKQLTTNGHQVIVITTAPNQALPDKKLSVTEEGGLKIYRLYPVNLYYYLDADKYPKIWRLFWHINNIFNWRVVSQVKKIMMAEKIEAVVLANLMGLSFLLPGLFRKMKLPVIQIMHDVQLLHPSGLFTVDQLGRGVGAKIYQFINKILFGSPLVVIFPSFWLKAQHESRGFFPASRKIVKQNPTLFNNSLPLADGNSNSFLKLLYIGQVEEHKGVLFIIKALKSIGHSMSGQSFGYQLDVVGDGAALAQAESLAGDDNNMIFHGRVSHEEVIKYYQQADLVIVPSLIAENAPTVIYEALVYGIPVLASRIGGIPELVREDDNGWLFQPGNVEDFKQKLLSLTPSQVSHLRQQIKTSYQPVRLEDYCQELVSFFS